MQNDKTPATPKKRGSKKTAGAPPAPASSPALAIQTSSPFDDDMEPLGPVYADEDDDESHGAVEAPIARNVGSLLTAPADEDEEPVSEEKPAALAATASAPHAAAVYWQEAKRIGPAHAKATLLRKLSDRVELHLAEVRKWGASEASVLHALSALSESKKFLGEAAEALVSLPVGWAPPARPGSAAGPKTLAAGTKVSVKEAARKEYDGALEPEEMTGLSVLKHEEGKSKVVCETAGKSRVVIARAHLAIDALPEPAAEGSAADED